MLDAKVSAHCNRVAVEDGHTECVSIKFKHEGQQARDILAAWSEFAPLAGQTSADARRISRLSSIDAIDRPQPRLDQMRGNGMTTTVGRLRECTSAGLEVCGALAQYDSRRGWRGCAER